MKTISSLPVADVGVKSPKVGRRGLVVGVGVAGATALAAQALHRGANPSTAVASAAPASEAGDGYRLTDHVKRYYETTRS